MKLVYLYVERFRTLKKQAFVFDTKYKCTYVNGRLDILTDKNALNDDFFVLTRDHPRGRVVNISAIVGKNGTGKTSLARFLLDAMRPSGNVGDFVAVFDDDSDGKPLVCWRKGFSEVGLNVTFDGQKLDESQMHRWPYLGKDAAWTIFREVKYVYYSPVYSSESVFADQRCKNVKKEPKKDKLGVPYINDIREYGFHDVSLSAAIAEAIGSGENKTTELALALHHRREVLSFVRAMVQYNGLSEVLGMPAVAKDNDLVFMVDRRYYDELMDGDVVEGLIGKDPVKKDLRRHFPVALPEDPIKAAFVCFAAEYLTDVSNEFAFVDVLPDSSNAVVEILSHLSALETQELVERLQEYEGGETRLPPLGVFLDRLEKLLSHATRVGKDLLWRVPLHGIEDNVFETYANAMEPYFECRGDRDVCSFGFKRQPSSGEMIYLMTWARLWSVFESMRDGRAGQKNVLLFMDEVETSFHPEWQRQFVKRMIVFWEAIMPRGYGLQIVFASHSPIILSDIPSDHVTYLMGQGDACDISPMGSFAANLFDLLNTGFFMDDGTIGAFACSKVNHVLDKINSFPRKALTTEDRRVIEMISDEILGGYLRRKAGIHG